MIYFSLDQNGDQTNRPTNLPIPNDTPLKMWVLDQTKTAKKQQTKCCVPF